MKSQRLGQRRSGGVARSPHTFCGREATNGLRIAACDELSAKSMVVHDAQLVTFGRWSRHNEVQVARHRKTERAVKEARAVAPTAHRQVICTWK